MKKRLFIILSVFIMLFGGGMIKQNQVHKLTTSDINEIMNSNNSSVSLGMATLTDRQLEGLILDIRDEYPAIIDKYVEILERTEASNVLTKSQILELHYYSLDGRKKEEFLRDCKNQHINIEVDNNGTILISYNVNIDSNKVY